MRFDRVALIVILVVCAAGMRWMRAPSPSSLPDLSAPRASLHLVPGVGVSVTEMEELKGTVERYTGREAFLDKSITLPRTAFKQERGQYDSEQLHSVIPSAAGEYWLAVVKEDLYTSQIPDWRYCYGIQLHHGGVLSTARLVAPERLQKMVLRYVLEGVYGLKRVDDDHGSLLYSRILGPDDVDRMEFRL